MNLLVTDGVRNDLVAIHREDPEDALSIPDQNLSAGDARKEIQCSIGVCIALSWSTDQMHEMMADFDSLVCEHGSPWSGGRIRKMQNPALLFSPNMSIFVERDCAFFFLK